MVRLNAKALKVTLVLNPAEVAAVHAPATSRVVLSIDVDGRCVTADIASKSLRKAQATIAEHGADNVACIVQGKLKVNTVAEAGLVVQPKKPTTESAEIAAHSAAPQTSATPQQLSLADLKAAAQQRKAQAAT
jgi:hypothetical protein